jgi:predicted secreted protein
MLSQSWWGLLVVFLMAACNGRHVPTAAHRHAAAATASVHAPASDALGAISRSDCVDAQANRGLRQTTARLTASEWPSGLHRVDAVAATEALDVIPGAAPLCLEVGQLLRIHLPASPATGYDWVLEQGPLPLLSLEIVPGVESSRLRTRAGRVCSWVFRAEHVGHAPLRFAYRRSWDAEPARFAEFDVTVR